VKEPTVINSEQKRSVYRSVPRQEDNIISKLKRIDYAVYLAQDRNQ
jgi:hypothetical protein